MMRSSRTVWLIAATVFMTACGQAASSVVAGDDDTAVTSAGAVASASTVPTTTGGSVVEVSTVDLDAAVAQQGACVELPDGSVIDIASPLGAWFREVVNRLEWRVAVGPFELGADSDDLFDRRTVELEVKVALPEEVGLRSVVESDGATEMVQVEVREMAAQAWPDDGVVLVGLRNGKASWPFSLYDDGVAAIGYCMGGFAIPWNAGVAELGLESYLDAWDMLFADPDDPRLDEALGIFPPEPEPEPVPWQDWGPRERTYEGAPVEVREHLERVALVIYIPDSWLGPNRDDLSLCTLTPEAVNECWALGSAKQQLNGIVGWVDTVNVVSGEPLTLVVMDRRRGLFDIVTVGWDLLSQAIVVELPGIDERINSVAIDLRTMLPDIENPDGLIDRLSEGPDVSLSIIDTPDRVITPLDTVEGD